MTQDSQASRTTLKMDQLAPQLRRNKKLEVGWSNEYYEALNQAVFSTEYIPYMPAEVPASIKEDVDKTGYVCKQCRDCFRFLSSIEEHTSRRSWVLGYWCQACFETKCTHVSSPELMCSACRAVVSSKHAYMAKKGVKRHVKKGVTKVFYNQCQFFAHLRLHGILMVEVNEIMLMPLPSDIRQEDYGKFDQLCKALMEIMFLKQVHIMDWIREVNLQSHRWSILLKWMESKDVTPITEIISHYSENCLNAEDLAWRTKKEALADRAEKKSASSPNSAKNEKDPLADNDDSPNDIAFVDCGPTPSNVAPEFPEEVPKNSENFCTVKRADLWQSFTPQSPKLMEKPQDPEPKVIKERAESQDGVKITRKASRVVTIRSSKNLSLSTIMKHLPIDGISSKNIVVMADQNKTAKVASKSENSSKTKNASQVTEAKLKEKTATSIVQVKSKAKPKVNSTPTEKNPRNLPLVTKSQGFSDQMSLHGKIVFQNGRKYIIRHVPKSKSQSILQNSLIKKLRSPPGLIAPTGGFVPVLPKPLAAVPAASKVALIPPGNQKAIAITRSAKRPKLPLTVVNASGLPLTAVKRKSEDARVAKVLKSIMVKSRESFMNDLHRCSRKELEFYIEHLRETTERYSKKIKFDDDFVVSANKKIILRFEKILNEATNEHSGLSSLDIPERSADWEKPTSDEKQRTCETCGKNLKPASYIIGISLPGIDESVYCQCYNTICHICESNQGSVFNLKAHVKWHKGEKPYTCPSCAIVFPSSLDLEVHVWTTCFHPMARFIFGCGVCEVQGIIDMESIARHFLMLHTKQKIICAECKIEYSDSEPTSEELEKHYIEHHNDIQISEPKRLLVCNLKQCIVRPESFRSHLTDHIGILKWICYKCPFCETMIHNYNCNKSLMREHLIENHLDRMHEVVSEESLPRILEGIKRVPQVPPASDRQTLLLNNDTIVPKILDARTITTSSFELENDEATDTKVPKILYIRSKAVDEFEELSSQDVEILPVRSARKGSPINNGKTLATKNLGSLSVSKSLISNVDRIDERASQSLRREDDDDSSNSHEDVTLISMDSKMDDSENSSSILESYSESQESDSKDSTNLTHLKGQEGPQRPWRIALNNPGDNEAEPVVYNCHLCGELINTSWSVIKNHFDSRHSSDYEIFTVSPTIPRMRKTPESGREDANGKRRKLEIIPAPSVKRRRRWGPKKHVERPGSPSFGICVKPETVEEIEGTFRCKKCEESFENRDALRSHIALQHRIKGQYLICLECGENFVVAPSLQMHLKALHGIEDPTSYLTKNSAYAPEILDDSEQDEKATESNQCYVCMAVFEDKSALDKHMRVHGMAFLRRKRFEAQRALKSSVRTNNTEDPPKVDSEKPANATSVDSVKKEDIEDRATNPSVDVKTEIDSVKPEIEKSESPIT